MAFSIHNVKPLHLYVLFVLLIFISTFFEGKVQIVYYVFVILGWASFFMAARNFIKQRKGKARKVTAKKK